MIRAVALALVLVLVLSAATAPATTIVGMAGAVPEPEGYWSGVMAGRTPATLRGAQVVDLDGLDRVLATPGAVLIDVSPNPPRPAGLTVGAYWAPLHRSIPGSHWLPGAGGADLNPARAGRLAAMVSGWTGGDHQRPVVVFCHPQCWASWNAGRRLVTLGYSRIHWFPGGIEAWQERHPTAPVTAEW
ncbi:MAG TPA: rhodanese-like domain-containing protein [Sphingomonas sp.]|jgi:PQQ-dependent catabolism-associated CXXCW motif protein|uniref:rhodanese-like domain-containing protein n=1 Tax=Sphingomonas sp. TaxID=28214 RepID=UPI002EDA11C7